MIGEEAVARSRGKTFTATSGQDLFKGRAGEDTFVFSSGSWGDTSGTADAIKNWSAADRIDMPVAGSFSNYEEGSISFSRIEDVVDCINDKGRSMYVFAFNAKTDTGYLLADLNRDHRYEMCLVLKGAGSSSDFDFANII